MNASLHLQRRCLGTVSVPKAFAALCSEAVGFGIVGCKLTAAVHFSPGFFAPYLDMGTAKPSKTGQAGVNFRYDVPNPTAS